MATCVICSTTTFVSPGYIGTAVKCRMCMHLGSSVAPPKEKKTEDEEMADMAAWGLDVALAHASRTEPVLTAAATAPVPRRGDKHLAKEAPIVAPVPIRLNHFLAREEKRPQQAKEAPIVAPVPIRLNHFLAREDALAKEARIVAPVAIRLEKMAREDPLPKRPPAKEAPVVPEAPKPGRFIQTRFQL